MSVFDLLYGLQQSQTIGSDTEPVNPVEEDIKKQIASGGSLPLILHEYQVAAKDQKKMMLTDYHPLITFGGLYLQEASDADYAYTQNFDYDPIRSSLGCFWIKEAPAATKKGLLRYACPNPHSDIVQLLDANINNAQKLQEQLGTNGVQFCSDIRQSVKYQFPTYSNYRKEGIEGFKISKPVKDESLSFLCKILALGKRQYLFYYFDFSDYSDKLKKLVPFNLFYTMKQKHEGVYYVPSSDDYEGDKFVTFNTAGTTASPYKSYQSMFINKKSTEEDLIAVNGLTDNAGTDKYNGVPFYFGQDYNINQINALSYSDHDIQSPAAISEEAIPFFGSELLQGNLIADVKPVYNYFLAEWEYITPQLPETYILSAYDAAYASKGGTADDYVVSLAQDFKSFAKSFIYCNSGLLESKISVYPKINPRVKKSQNIIIEPNRALDDLVEDIKTQFPMYNEISFTQTPPGNISTAMRETGLTIEFIKTLMTYVYGDHMDTSVEGNLKKNSRLLALASMVPKIIESKKASIISTLKDPASFDFFERSEESLYSEDDIACYDFLSWLEWYMAELDEPPKSDELKLYNKNYYAPHCMFFGDQKFRNKFHQKNMNNFFKTIGLIQFMDNFANSVSAQSRNMDDIFSTGERHFAYSEVLYYRIEKRNPATRHVINNFFVLPEELDTEKGYRSRLKVIDTQIKYGVPYEYKIYAVKVVIGTEYKYLISTHTNNQKEQFLKNTTLNVQNSSEIISTPQIKLPTAHYSDITLYTLYQDGEYTSDKAVMPIRVDYRPTVKIYECPLYEEADVIVRDNPPLPPLVNIYPLYGKRDKMLMTLETQTGDRELEPISMLPGDTSYFVMERAAQKRNVVYPGGEYIYPTLRFKADDDSSRYEVYRIEGEENVPLKYEDFADHLHTTLDKMQPIPEAGFEDDIKVNTKYYYTFRCRDMHGNISNPTGVYEVEMIDVGNDVYYPSIRMRSFNELENIYESNAAALVSMDEKPVQSRVQIRAAQQQILLNEDKSGITGETAVEKDIVLGFANKSLWDDKRFKFRFTSRHTGKKIDINVKFNVTNNKPSTTTGEAIDTCYDPFAVYEE